jgi:hypothetical protein
MYSIFLMAALAAGTGTPGFGVGSNLGADIEYEAWLDTKFGYGYSWTLGYGPHGWGWGPPGYSGGWCFVPYSPYNQRTPGPWAAEALPGPASLPGVPAGAEVLPAPVPVKEPAKEPKP